MSARSDFRAHNLVNRAVAAGIITRPAACEECGQAPVRRRDSGAQVEAHHDDYNEPLRVRWLCKRCHAAWHRFNVATPARPDLDLEPFEAMIRKRAPVDADPVDALLAAINAEVDLL